MLKKANFSHIKNALSVVSGNPVGKKNLILQSMARSIGYSTYEKCQKHNDRQCQLINGVWVDYAPCFDLKDKSISNKIVIQSGYSKLILNGIRKIDSKGLVLEFIFQNIESDGENELIQIPLSNKGFVHNVEVEDLIIKKDEVSFFCTGKLISVKVSRLNNYTQFTIFCDSEAHYTSNRYELVDSRFIDPKWQIPRIIYECMAVSVNEIDFKSKDVELSDIIDTAYYLHYQNLNNHFGDLSYPTEKPENIQVKHMSMIAHSLLKCAVHEDLEALMESMDINHAMLEDLLQLTSHEYEWFIATNEQ